jgi:hypothetical protein
MAETTAAPAVQTRSAPGVVSFGPSAWTRADMLARLEEFAELYQCRPVRDNMHGMMSPHLFLFWFILRHLKPDVVIESGVWKGQGTWFIEQACPQAEIFSIDINWSHLQYRSTRARYLDSDFSTHDWERLPKERTVAFFDDHVDAIKRIRMCVERGFRHLIFEDNYPPGRGDCYSLQEVFLHAGHRAFPGLRARISRALGRLQDRNVGANAEDAAYLHEVAQTYEVMPPVFKLATTRWGDPWDERYPTPEPLLREVAAPYQQLYLDEAAWYTWLCYVALKDPRSRS